MHVTTRNTHEQQLVDNEAPAGDMEQNDMHNHFLEALKNEYMYEYVWLYPCPGSGYNSPHWPYCLLVVQD